MVSEQQGDSLRQDSSAKKAKPVTPSKPKLNATPGGLFSLFSDEKAPLQQKSLRRKSLPVRRDLLANKGLGRENTSLGDKHDERNYHDESSAESSQSRAASRETRRSSDVSDSGSSVLPKSKPRAAEKPVQYRAPDPDETPIKSNKRKREDMRSGRGATNQ